MKITLELKEIAAIKAGIKDSCKEFNEDQEKVFKNIRKAIKSLSDEKGFFCRLTMDGELEFEMSEEMSAEFIKEGFNYFLEVQLQVRSILKTTARFAERCGEVVEKYN